MLGDGTPDDISIFLISAELDGKHAIYLVKPEGKTRYGALDNISIYVNDDYQILFVIDQENEELKDILSTFIGRIKSHGVEMLGQTKMHDRLYKFESKLGPKKFELYLIINGLDEVKTVKHSVEDHLLKCAELIKMPISSATSADSKKVYEELVRQKAEYEERIYREVLSRAEECFPQQYKALESIEHRLR